MTENTIVAPDEPYRAHTYEDLLNALPAMFGFVPRNSIIGMCVSGPRSRFGFRLRHDLPPVGREAELAEMLAAHLVRNGGEDYFLFALGDDVDRARTMAMALQDALPPRTCQVVLWANAVRVWSDHPAHPEEGEPYVLSEHHEARVRAVAAGHVVLADRAELADEVAGPTGERARWIDRAYDVVVDGVLTQLVRDSHDDVFDHWRQKVAGLIDRWLSAGTLTDGELVDLVVGATAIVVRDEAWFRIDRDNAVAMHALWSAACRVAPDDFAPAAASLAGFAAWQAGDGARSLVALERALQCDPDYSMAQLVLQMLQAGIHPDRWHETPAIA